MLRKSANGVGRWWRSLAGRIGQSNLIVAPFVAKSHSSINSRRITRECTREGHRSSKRRSKRRSERSSESCSQRRSKRSSKCCSKRSSKCRSQCSMMSSILLSVSMQQGRSFQVQLIQQCPSSANGVGCGCHRAPRLQSTCCRHQWMTKAGPTMAATQLRITIHHRAWAPLQNRPNLHNHPLHRHLHNHLLHQHSQLQSHLLLSRTLLSGLARNADCATRCLMTTNCTIHMPKDCAMIVWRPGKKH